MQQLNTRQEAAGRTRNVVGGRHLSSSCAEVTTCEKLRGEGEIKKIIVPCRRIQREAARETMAMEKTSCKLATMRWSRLLLPFSTLIVLMLQGCASSAYDAKETLSATSILPTLTSISAVNTSSKAASAVISSVTFDKHFVGRHGQSALMSMSRRQDEVAATNGLSASLRGSANLLHAALSTSAVSSASCTEATDGVSVISPVVLNGTRYGACYKGTGFEFNGYPAYYAEPLDTTADIQSERAVLVTTVEDVKDFDPFDAWSVVSIDQTSGNVTVICFNLISPSTVSSPTSGLLDGNWVCGVPGERPWSVIEGVELNCGCPAGPADEKYYLCNEYEDISIATSVVYGGVSFSGCYTVEAGLLTSDGFRVYFSGIPEEGVPVLFVSDFEDAETGGTRYYWNLGVYQEDLSLKPACALVTLVDSTSDVPLAIVSGDDWLCDLNGDGNLTLTQGIEVDCACIDASYTSCFENGAGVYVDSALIYVGQSIGGCYRETTFGTGGDRIFTPTGTWEPVIGYIYISQSFITAPAYSGYGWSFTLVEEYDAGTGMTRERLLCYVLMEGAEEPTDPILAGRWQCDDPNNLETGMHLLKNSDFHAVECGCPTGDGSEAVVPRATPTNISPPTGSSVMKTPIATGPEEAPTWPPFMFSPPGMEASGSTNNVDAEDNDSGDADVTVGIIVGIAIGATIIVLGVGTMLMAEWRRKQEADSSATGPTQDMAERRNLQVIRHSMERQEPFRGMPGGRA